MAGPIIAKELQETLRRAFDDAAAQRFEYVTLAHLLIAPTDYSTARKRIRALVGSFANGNQTQFNRPDGAGYDFLADFAVDLDRRNPQTAARLLVSFRSWRTLEPGRRARAEQVLKRIAEVDDLSPDTRDIVTRTLG